jgi:hypothetical protein
MAPIRSALIRRPQIIVTAAHSVLALQNSELVPAEFVDAVLRLGTRDACACAAAAHKMQRNSSGSVLCSAAKAKRPAEPDLSIALQWLLAVTLCYESALALGGIMGLVPRTKRDWALCLALSGIRNCPVRPDRVESVCVARAFHTEGRVPPRPPTAIGAWLRIRVVRTTS